MPLPIAHGFFGASAAAAGLFPKKYYRNRFIPVAVCAVLSVLPDLDFLFVFATGNEKWHRGFTHSIAFALLVGLIIHLYLGRRRWREALAYSFAYASHFILDFLTTKVGGGLELFFPFSAQRFKLGWFGFSEFTSKLTFSGLIEAAIIEFCIFAPLFLIVAFLTRKHADGGKLL